MNLFLKQNKNNLLFKYKVTSFIHPLISANEVMTTLITTVSTLMIGFWLLLVSQQTSVPENGCDRKCHYCLAPQGPCPGPQTP